MRVEEVVVLCELCFVLTLQAEHSTHQQLSHRKKPIIIISVYGNSRGMDNPTSRFDPLMQLPPIDISAGRNFHEGHAQVLFFTTSREKQLLTKAGPLHLSQERKQVQKRAEARRRRNTGAVAVTGAFFFQV